MQKNTHPLNPTSEEIARLAYLIWEKEGRPQGCDMNHWFEAESLLMAATRKELKTLHAATHQHSQRPTSARKVLNSRINHFTGRAAA
ncbi:MAG: DUF2934 domain-containing protein [Verrucomicrobia bacterium]|nr:DUF2934 domain-containing protein [Verrucomicrobiota bacterium]